VKIIYVFFKVLIRPIMLNGRVYTSKQPV